MPASFPESLVRENPSTEESENFVTNAVIAACLVGIVIVAALIVTTPRQKESFTQLWLKPWKVNLTNLTQEDPIRQALGPTQTSSLATGDVLGNAFYVELPSLKIGFLTDVVNGGANRTFDQIFAKSHMDGDTIWLGSTALYLDAIDSQNRQVLFWEYPRNPSAQTGIGRLVRFAFVIENDLGRDHEYRAQVNFSIGNATSVKVSQKIFVPNGAQKTCVIGFHISEEEVAPILREQGSGKVSVRLDTGEEVFFWLSRYISYS